MCWPILQHRCDCARQVLRLPEHLNVLVRVQCVVHDTPAVCCEGIAEGEGTREVLEEQEHGVSRVLGRTLWWLLAWEREVTIVRP